MEHFYCELLGYAQRLFFFGPIWSNLVYLQCKLFNINFLFIVLLHKSNITESQVQPCC